METVKTVLSKSILASFRTIGAGCEKAEYGVSSAIRFAGDSVIETIGLKPNDSLDHETWMATRDSIEAGYHAVHVKGDNGVVGLGDDLSLGPDLLLRPLLFGDVTHRRLQKLTAIDLRSGEQNRGRELLAGEAPMSPFEEMVARAHRGLDHLPGLVP